MTRALSLDQFTRLKFEIYISLDLILKIISLHDAHWEYKDGKPKKIATGMLLFKAFCRFKFIISNIMPTLKESHVFYKRCQLIYAILCGIEIDVDMIIKVQMRHCLFKPMSKRMVLPFVGN